MPEEEKKTLYIFIDESGNFDFSENGTKYFALTAVSSLTPLKSRDALLAKVYATKYKGWNEGRDDYYFHATEDKQEVRDWVFAAIKQLDDIAVDVIVAQKNKANPSLYIERELQPNFSVKTVRYEEKFYEKISQMLLQYICNRYQNKADIGKVVVILGSLFTDRKRGYVLKSLKQYLREHFSKPSYIYFHDTSSDINCQIADYCGWAAFVRAERNEQRPWAEIKGKVKSCFNVFDTGTTEYYQYKK